MHFPLVGRPLAATLQGLTWRFGKTRLGRGWSERSGVGFPLGYFMIAEKIASGTID
jgi:hypothetical protein